MSQGYSLAYGARFLKRVIDDRVKLPISARWREDPFTKRCQLWASRRDASASRVAPLFVDGS